MEIMTLSRLQPMVELRLSRVGYADRKWKSLIITNWEDGTRVYIMDQTCVNNDLIKKLDALYSRLIAVAEVLHSF